MNTAQCKFGNQRSRRPRRSHRARRLSPGGLLAVCLGLALSPAANAGPEIPGAPQTGPIALVGGTLHPIDGPVVENGTLLFDGGKITAIGAQAPLPPKTTVVRIPGKHVYPGLFDAYTQLGLLEIDAVRATLDFQETGRLNPNAKAQTALQLDSELIPVTRSNGVLLALTAPSGGLLSGKSVVWQLDGWTFEDATLRAEAGLHVDWPEIAARSGGESTSNDAAKDPLAELRQAFRDARAYQAARHAAPQTTPRDLRWDAMLPVLAGEQPLIASADELRQIESAVAFSQTERVRLVIHGGYDAADCGPLLKACNVPVILAGVHRLPMRRSDPYDAPFTLAARLRAAGVKFCIAGGARFSAANARNLPYHAATAAAYGLPAEEALRAITLDPAEILGVQDRVGSLAVGKDATLIVTDGDPLETAAQVELAFVQGRAVELSDRHKRLFRKYEIKQQRRSAP